MTKRNKLTIIISSIIIVLLIGTGVTYLIIASSVINGMADVRIVKNENTLSDFDLTGYSFNVTTADNIDINSYVVPNSASKANVIILHGMHGMDATSLFDYAKFIYDAGYTPIIVDMRAHGNSTGESLSFGYNEPLDVIAVIDYISADNDLKDKPIVIYGLSMGGSVAINTAALSDKVDGIIAISPYKSIQGQVSDYMARDGASSLFIKSFMPAINLKLRMKFKTNPKINSPINQISKMRDIPMLIIHGDNDTQTNYNHSEELYSKSVSSNKQLWIVEDAEHLIVDNVLAESSEDYRLRVIEWLDAIYE